MEQAGVKIDRGVLARNVDAPGARSRREGARDLRPRRSGIQHQFAQATRRRALQQAESAQAGEVRQGQNDFDRGRRSRRTGRRARSAAAGARISTALEAQIHVRRRAAAAAEPRAPAGCIPRFGQTGTATGRLSSANPNLQNIPIRTELGREIRAAFTAEPGHVLLAADYSQIELRLLAHFSEDPLLVEAFRRGDDIHTLTASQVFGVPPLMVTADHRRQAKVVNFGIVYGLSAFGLSQQLGIEPGEAKQFINAYFEKYKGVRNFIDKTLEATRRDGKVSTLFGRVRPIPDINSKNTNLRGFAERTAVNTPLQGTAADLIKIAMIRIDAALRERRLKTRMTLQVHDELVMEVPLAELDEVKSLVKEKMEKVHPLDVPLMAEIGVGSNWRDLEY